VAIRQKLIGEMSRAQVTRRIGTLLEKRFNDPGLWTPPFWEVQPGFHYSEDRIRYKVDFVVFKKRGRNAESIGVEIKSCRADFKTDKKWEQYLKHFSRFYFACPRGVIDPEELPDEVGLLTWSGSDFLRSAKAAKTAKDKMGADMDSILMLACLQKL